MLTRIWVIVLIFSWFLDLHGQAESDRPLAETAQEEFSWQPDARSLTQLHSGEPQTLMLPIPGQGLQPVLLTPDPLLPPGLQKRYPQIRTWIARESGYHLSLVSGPSGVHILYNHQAGSWLLEPMSSGVTHRLAPLSNWASKDQLVFSCGNKPNEFSPWTTPQKEVSLRENQVSLYQYVIAVATTGEYYRANGNTPELVLENVVKVVAQVNTVMTRDVGIKLILAENTDTLFFKDGATDPYTNGNTTALLSENITVIQSRIPFSQFDVGHVFGTNAGGQAFLGAVCGANKASGASSTFGIYGGALFYLIAAHELGHQFGASHTFNLCDGDNESSGTAYEPGSGSTVMCYAGASNCGANYVQDRNDPYFHHASLQQITNFKVSAGARCADVLPVNSKMPVANILPQNITHIPRGTPLKLNGEGNDPDGDSLTHVWEQYNLGPASPLGSPIGDAPSFRSVPPSRNSFRIIPQLTDLLANRSLMNEVLPTYARNVTFRYTVRDNHQQAGSFAWEEIGFRVDTTAGPFKVIFPNTNRDTLAGGKYQLIRWDVANTDNEQVRCQEVNIFLSLDGGFTWTDTLAMHSANDGSEYLFIPAVTSNVARIIIEGSGHVFFDLSDRNVVIIPDPTGSSLALTPNSLTICAPGSELTNLRFSGLDPQDILLNIINAPTGMNLTTGPADQNELPLTITLDRPLSNQVISIGIQVILHNDTLVFDLPVKVISSVVDPIIPVAPAPAQIGLTSFTSFEWMPLADATSYQLQVSSNPSFSTTIIDTTLGSFRLTSSAPLEAKTIYYWRVKAANDCRSGNWSALQVFQTEIKNCRTYQSTDTPFFGVPPFESVIQIEDNYRVSEVNVPKVHGFHEFMGNVTLTLLSPQDSQTVLLKEKCTNLSNYHLGFDDDAQALSKCPLTDQKIYKPEQPLIRLINQSSRGSWRLRVSDKASNAGTVQAWTLELCTQSATNAPFLDKNLPLEARANGTTALSSDGLRILDADTPPEQLVFTLLEIPLKGSLGMSGQALSIGAKFTQADINAGRVTYRPFNADTLPDHFVFLVEDGQGGWISPQTFDIVIDKATSVAQTASLSFSISPNPANQTFVLTLSDVNSSDGFMMMVTDLTGRMWWQEQLDRIASKRIILPANLPGGLYLVTVRNSTRIGVKKLFIQSN